MEGLLALYAEPHDPKRPVVCFDETAKQLVAETRIALPLAPGTPERVDYEYERKGTANLFLLCQPLGAGGTARSPTVGPSTTSPSRCRCWSTAAARTRRSCRIVLDNLNTHTPAALYEAFAPAEARRILKKLEFHYTPVHGNWLNLAELEFSMLSRQCLGRRVPDRDTLATAVAAWAAARNEQRANISWQFTVEDARARSGCSTSAASSRIVARSTLPSAVAYPGRSSTRPCW